MRSHLVLISSQDRNTKYRVACDTLRSDLGDWKDSFSKGNSNILVQMIRNISYVFQPLIQSLLYLGGTRAKRLVRWLRSFWGAGIRVLGGVAMLWMSMIPATLRANPQGEVVVGGAAAFNRPDAATLIVNQNADRAVINWNSFSIANGELTKFVQPNSSSAVLNRVVTANPS